MLVPKSEYLERYQTFAANRDEIINAGTQRQLWLDQQERIAKAQGAKNDEDEAMSEDDVDWHDFVIVEQIELYNNQEMLAQQ